MNAGLPSVDHPIWRAGGSLLVGYGVIVTVIFVLFFLVSWAIFSMV
ncbi:MAG: hypothetical protein ABEJ55_06110 [Halanaeroarchaeum sp.]